jgi:hypothetical protein
MSRTLLHWIGCGLALAAITSPAAAQTTGRNPFATGGFAASPASTTGTATAVTPTGPGPANSDTASALPVEWQEIIDIAESLIEEFDLTFSDTWEEAVFILMVARIHMQLRWWNHFGSSVPGGATGGGTSAGTGTIGNTTAATTTTSPAAGTAAPRPFATGGFGARRR